MNHRKSGRKLNRNSPQRAALFLSLTNALIEHESITTTLAKAKELRRFAEPLITMAKTDTVAARRRAFSKLRNKANVAKLFTVLGPRFKERPGGYLQILKTGPRVGDAAPMAIVRWVERTEEQTEAA